MSSKLELGGSSFYFLARTVRKDTLAFLRSVAMSKAPILRSIEFRKKPSLDLDFNSICGKKMRGEPRFGTFGTSTTRHDVINDDSASKTIFF